MKSSSMLYHKHLKSQHDTDGDIKIYCENINLKHGKIQARKVVSKTPFTFKPR